MDTNQKTKTVVEKMTLAAPNQPWSNRSINFSAIVEDNTILDSTRTDEITDKNEFSFHSKTWTNGSGTTVAMESKTTRNIRNVARNQYGIALNSGVSHFQRPISKNNISRGANSTQNSIISIGEVWQNYSLAL